MNAKKAKALRKIARSMVTSTVEPTVEFFQERVNGLGLQDSLVPTTLTWGKGTFRQIYQSLK